MQWAPAPTVPGPAFLAPEARTMKLSKFALPAGLTSLALLVSASVALADDPSFKRGKDKETEEFCKQVFTALIKGTRNDPRDVTLTKYSYATVKGKEGRKTLTLTGTFKGSLTKKKFTEKWTLSLDTSDPKEWEVTKWEVSTDHTLKPKQKNVEKVIKDLNR
jgi:hypothetical protein